MPQFNVFSMRDTYGQGRLDRQAEQLNDLKIREAERITQQQQREISEEQQLANTRWLAGASKVLLETYQRDPDRFYEAADELGRVGIEKGVIDPDQWDPQLVTQERVQQIYDNAMVGLAGRPVVPREPGQGNTPAKIQQYEYYMGNVAPEGTSPDEGWRLANQTDPGMKTIKVPMPDGSELMVNYDSASGEGYDLTSGQRMIVRPSAQGDIVYGQDGPIGIGRPVAPAQQAPAGFGRSQTPADKKQAEIDVERESQMEQVVNSQLTQVENSFRLQPMMEAAIEGANAWNTAWGSLLAAVPGSQAKDLASTILTIKANIGFDRLQKMRMESPTGGALGQVAVQELNALQSTISNLDQSQSTEQFKANMRIALEQYRTWTRAWGEAIMREGTRDQKMRYYAGVPKGQTYMHPDGSWRVKTE